MLDYAFMQEILQRLNEVYPDRIYNAHGDAQDDEKIVRHMVYLVEHGMVEAHISKDKRGYNIGRAKITPKGIDFLRPDGGLSALAAPVIRIAPESLAGIIDAALAARNIPAADRSLVQKTLGIAGPEGVKAIVQRLMDAGMAHAPDVLSLLRLP